MFKESLNETDIKQLNTVMNMVVKKVREEARQQAVQDTMKIYPAMIDYRVKGAIAARDFWQRNPALKAYCEKYPQIHKYVKFRTSEIQKQNPNFTLEQVFNQTEKEVKNLLKGRLKDEPAGDSNNGGGKKKNASLVTRPGGGRKNTVPKPKGGEKSEQEQIAELINLDR